MTGSKIKEMHTADGYPFHISECGKVVVNVWTLRNLSQCSCKKGYLRVWSGGAFNRRRSFMVHRLVALAWLECPAGYEDMDVNHKDGNKQNNHYSNLEWVTHAKNMKHAIDTGLWKKENGGRPGGSVRRKKIRQSDVKTKDGYEPEENW